MQTRTITNSGYPLTDSNLNILANTQIFFELVDGCCNAAGSFAPTGEYIAPVRGIATTTDGGLFNITLPCTDNMVDPRYYLCTVDHPDCPEFMAPLFYSGSPLQWVNFRRSGATIPPDLLDPFRQHMQDTAIHNPALGATFLAHCSIDTETGLPLWDGGPWPGSGGVTPTTDYMAADYVATDYVA